MVQSVAPPQLWLHGPRPSLEAALVFGNGVKGAVARDLYDVVRVRVAAGDGEDGGKGVEDLFFCVGANQGKRRRIRQSVHPIPYQKTRQKQTYSMQKRNGHDRKLTRQHAGAVD